MRVPYGGETAGGATVAGGVGAQYTPAAGWATYPVWRVSDGVTRPILFIDQSNFVLHVFASSSVSGGRILEKTSPINSISLAFRPPF